MRKDVKRIGIILSITFNIAFIGGYCYKAFWHREEKAGFNRARMDKVFSALRLSDEQNEEIERSRSLIRSAISKIRTQINTHRLELVELLALPYQNKEAIELKRREINLLQEKVQKLVLDGITKSKEILTPEQQRTLFSYLRRRATKRLKVGH